MAELDRRAAEEFGLSTSALMERAGRHVAAVVSSLLEAGGGYRILVLAGKGNNGGDGLVAARHLRGAGIEVSALLLAREDALGGDVVAALRAAAEAGVPYRVLGTESAADLPALLASADLIIDAVFGTGFRGPVKGLAGDVLAAANKSGKPIVAVDVPSGLEVDSGRLADPVIHATATVTLGLPKIGLLTHPGAETTGDLYVADLGYPSALIDDLRISTSLVTAAMVRSRFPPRRPDSHKGDYGRVLIIAGSVGFSGAATLAALGALRSGAGLVTLGVPAAIYSIVASRVPEVMPTPLPGSNGSIAADALDRVNVLAKASDIVAVGPGLSTDNGVLPIVRGLLGNDRPLVIDADGLNVLAGNTRILAQTGKPVVITPHPGELGRLLDQSVSTIQTDRITAARTAASRFKCTVLLKGARTVVAAAGGEVFIVPTGNPGMATGGMGDVLTGAVAALIGQRMEPLHAAYAGAYLHGLAGDLIADARGPVGMLASEVADHLPVAIHRVRSGQYTEKIVTIR